MVEVNAMQTSRDVDIKQTNVYDKYIYAASDAESCTANSIVLETNRYPDARIEYDASIQISQLVDQSDEHLCSAFSLPPFSPLSTTVTTLRIYLIVGMNSGEILFFQKFASITQLYFVIKFQWHLSYKDATLISYNSKLEIPTQSPVVHEFPNFPLNRLWNKYFHLIQQPFQLAQTHDPKLDDQFIWN